MNSLPKHPYANAPDRAFWSKSIAKTFTARDLLETSGAVISRHDRVVSAGSCFASNLPGYLEKVKIAYIRTETTHPNFLTWPEDRYGYSQFSAAYGNIYTARQLRQLLLRATGKFRPAEHFWIGSNEIIDPYRPGLRYKARSVQEFDALTTQHLLQTKLAFAQATVFVFTLGLTEAWTSAADGAVFPVCPGTITGTFNPDKHTFRNFTTSEVITDINASLDEIRKINHHCRFILTVSPVPLVATATSNHVLCASTYSKSALRAAAQEVSDTNVDVLYFPAFEIVMNPSSPTENYFAADRRTVTKEGVAQVMATLLNMCPFDLEKDAPQAINPAAQMASPSDFAKVVVDADCEELMTDQ